ncbi:MAG: biopolymer transporter ExbD [Spirochaetes bacterium]|nr:biopolymer transporter ExbD [Spirochaetota bacterium]
MRIRIPRRTGADIGESGTLSDLAFLLIIFFIVIAVFNVNRGFLLGLPRPDSKRVVQRQDLLQADLARDGSIRVEGRVMSLSELSTRLRETRRLRPNMTFALRIDPDTPYQRVVDMIDLVRRLDIDNFSFSMGNLSALGDKE